MGLFSSAEALIPVSALVFVAAITALLFHKIVCPGSSLPATTGWIQELSVERYRPMLRLLDGKDIDFLRFQPGFAPWMVKKLRIQRRQVFRGYLRHLTDEFGRITLALKLIMLHSNRDRPDLAKMLIRSQIAFAFGLTVVYLRLTLYRLGFCSVSASRLLSLFDAMRTELRMVIPAGAAAGG